MHRADSFISTLVGRKYLRFKKTRFRVTALRSLMHKCSLDVLFLKKLFLEVVSRSCFSKLFLRFCCCVSQTASGPQQLCTSSLRRSRKPNPLPRIATCRTIVRGRSLSTQPSPALGLITSTFRSQSYRASIRAHTHSEPALGDLIARIRRSLRSPRPVITQRTRARTPRPLACRSV